MKIFYLILSQKQIIFRVIIKCNNIFETNILYRGYPTKLNNNRNSRGLGVWQAPHGMEILSRWGSSAKVPSVEGGGMDIFWNYKIWAWGSINCSIWTQSCIIIVEKVTKKQSWHSLQHQGSAAISLAKPLHWRRVGCNVERISCIGCYLIFIFIYIIYIPISIIYLYIYH